MYVDFEFVIASQRTFIFKYLITVSSIKLLKRFQDILYPPVVIDINTVDPLSAIVGIFKSLLLMVMQI